MAEQKKPKLTRKQAGFVRDYVANGNGTQAIIKNYNITSRGKGDYVARVMASRNLKKPNVAIAIQIELETLRSALIKQGVTPQKIARKVDQLLESADDNSVDKGLRHATAIYGIEGLDKPKANNVYNFIFNAEAQAEIKAIEEKIKQRLTHAPENQNHG